MAIRDKIISGGNGINFTKETDSSSDWSGITNSTYFRDVADGLIHYKDPTGTIQNVFPFPFTGSAVIAKELKKTRRKNR